METISFPGETENKHFLMVCAVDFGTCFSGYAFSFKNDFKQNPLKISVNTSWVGGGTLKSLKTPTAILINQKGEFDSFGYDAEDKYSQLVANNQYSEWMYFRRFKMALYHEEVSTHLYYVTCILLFYVLLYISLDFNMF